MKSTPLNANEIQHDNEKLGCMKIRPKCENENYLSTQSFTGKNVVVTAAEYGVGEAVAIAFAKEGANIVLVYNQIKNLPFLENLTKRINEIGAKVWLFCACLVDEDKCRKLFNEIRGVAKYMDIIVNILPVLNKAEEKMAPSLFSSTSNPMQCLLTMGKVAPAYLSSEGVIINATYISSYAPPDQLPVFSIIKAAIKNYTHELQQVLLSLKRNIRAHAITAGFVWSEILPETIPNYNLSDVERTPACPMHPCELAPVFVFVAKTASAVLAGQTIDARGKTRHP